MPSRFQGTALPACSATTPADNVQKISSTSANFGSTGAHEASRTRVRRGSLSDWIARQDPVPATVAMISRARWCSLIDSWAASEAGTVARGRYNVSLKRFLAVAHAMARHCDGSTGRNIAVCNERLAAEGGCSTRLVTNVRAVLIGAGYLYKSSEGVSSRTGRFNRPPIVHLTMPRPGGVGPSSPASSLGGSVGKNCRKAVATPVDNQVSSTSTGGRVCDLLRSTAVGHISSARSVVGKPNARTRTRRNAGGRKSLQERRRWFLAYAIADELISRTVGLQGARGPVAAALNFSHLDLSVWTALKLKAALDAWGVTHRDSSGVLRQMDWPSTINRPGAFLAYRLSHLEAAPPAEAPTYVPAPPAPATGAGRSRAWAAITEHLAGLRRTRTDRLRGREECPLCSGASLNADLCQHCRPVTGSDMPITAACAAQSA